MPGLSPLGGLLREDHFHIVEWINDLQRWIIIDIGEYAPDASEDCNRQQMQRLSCALDQILLHHAFEEAVLFPLLREPDGRNLANYLANDHATIEPITRRLQAATREILRCGADQERWQTFRAYAQELHLEMISHLMLEEIVLVQQLPELIDSDLDRELAKRHAIGRFPAVDTQRPFTLH